MRQIRNSPYLSPKGLMLVIKGNDDDKNRLHCFKLLLFFINLTGTFYGSKFAITRHETLKLFG